MALFDFFKKKKNQDTQPGVVPEYIEPEEEEEIDDVEELDEAEEVEIAPDDMESVEPETVIGDTEPLWVEEELPADEDIVEPESELEPEFEPEPELEPEPEEETVPKPPVEKKKGLFSRLVEGLGKTRGAFTEKVDGVFAPSRKIDDDLYDELEEALILADIGGSTSMEIVDTLRQRVKEKRISGADAAKAELRAIISEILSQGDSKLRLDTTPSVVLVIGVNGVGKTTTIGKLTNKLKNEGETVVLAAADTFRAAAADQLEIWAQRNGVQLVRLTEGADPAAVIFDGCNAAKSRSADVLICDTAGRLHNKKNLMEELKKINRVIERELPSARKEVLLVLDATTGQNAVNQAEEFNKVAELTGIVLTKLDGTAKGGIVIQIIQKLGIPVKFIGVGEGIDDLQVFNADDFAAALFSEE